MRHALWILLTILATTPAAAADWFVNTARLGDGSGTSVANACTLGTAMSGARAGDRVFLANGDYTNRRVLVPGSSGTSSQPIEIRGNPANPAAVVVRGFRVGNGVDYIWYRYLRVAGDLHVCAQDADSVLGIRLSNVTATGSFFGRNPSRCLLDSCKVYPRQTSGGFVDNWFAFGWSDECPFGGYGYGTAPGGCAFDTIRACSLFVRQSGGQNCPVLHMVKITGQSDPPTQLNTLRLRFCLLRGNRFVVVKAPGAGEVRSTFIEGVLRDSIQDTRWDVRDSSGVLSEFNFRVKFKAHYLVFERDSFYLSGTSAMMQLSSQGNSDPRWTQGHNKWKDCFFKITSGGQGNGGYAGIDFWWGMNADTIQGCAVISSVSGGTPLGLGSSVGQVTGYEPDASGNNVATPATSVLDHNTLVVTTNGADYDGADGWFNPVGIASQGTLKVTNNILASTNAAFPSRCGGAHYVFPANSNLQCNHNLYFARALPPTHSVIYQFAGGSKTYTKVGDPAGAWCATRGQDCASRDAINLAAIAFRDSTVASFDPQILVGSAAQFGPDGYVGARTIAGGVDVIPPAPINTLGYLDRGITGSLAQVTLLWDAAEDDGPSGLATAYELRYSTAPIDAANFESATLYGGAPVPASAGALQTVIVSRMDRSRDTWWAIRAVDEAGNKSAPSNAIVVHPPRASLQAGNRPRSRETGAMASSSPSSDRDAGP